MEIKKKPSVDTQAITPVVAHVPPPQSPAGMPSLDDPQFDQKMRRMQDLVYLQAMQKMSGTGPRESVPVAAPSAGGSFSAVTKTVEQLKSFYEAEASLKAIVAAREDNPLWLRALNTSAGAGIGAAFGRLIEGVLANMERKAQLEQELKLQEMKNKSKPAPSADMGGGFDLFGESASTTPSTPPPETPPPTNATAVAAAAPAVSGDLDKKVEQLATSVNSLAQIVNLLAQKQQAANPNTELRTWKFGCKGKDCGFIQFIVAANETAASRVFHRHLVTHPSFSDEAKAMKAEGVTPPKAQAFATSWITVEEIKESEVE